MCPLEAVNVGGSFCKKNCLPWWLFVCALRSRCYIFLNHKKYVLNKRRTGVRWYKTRTAELQFGEPKSLFITTAESEFGGTKPVPLNSSSANPKACSSQPPNRSSAVQNSCSRTLFGEPKSLLITTAELEFGGTMDYRSKEIFPFWINSSPSGQRTRM